MQKLKIAFSEKINSNDPIEKISLHLDSCQRHSIENVPWPAYPYHPEVYFAIAHSGNCIFLKFYVEENFIQAATGSINGPVWEDASVEFFISFDEKGYYNFEFNCIGTALAGFGKEKNTRELLTEEIINKINYEAVIRNKKKNKLISWELTLKIPVDVFIHHHISSLHEKKCSANFYKCGDHLPEPHFIAWSNIQSTEPNFHLPEFFGELEFE
jgi:hypothetical protein